MPDVGDGGELGENASVTGADSGEADVADGLQTPVELGPLVLGERGGAVQEFRKARGENLVKVRELRTAGDDSS